MISVLSKAKGNCVPRKYKEYGLSVSSICKYYQAEEQLFSLYFTGKGGGNLICKAILQSNIWHSEGYCFDSLQN
jgi:hypothetical protein